MVRFFEKFEILDKKNTSRCDFKSLNALLITLSPLTHWSWGCSAIIGPQSEIPDEKFEGFPNSSFLGNESLLFFSIAL